MFRMTLGDSAGGFKVDEVGIESDLNLCGRTGTVNEREREEGGKRIYIGLGQGLSRNWQDLRCSKWGQHTVNHY